MHTIVNSSHKELEAKYWKEKNDSLLNSKYWGSEHAARGYYYLFRNEGKWSLLVPDSQLLNIDKIKAAQCVRLIVSEYDERKRIICVFDDGTDFPFVLQVDADQSDREITPGRYDFSAYSRSKEFAQLSACCEVDQDIE